MDSWMQPSYDWDYYASDAWDDGYELDHDLDISRRGGGGGRAGGGRAGGGRAGRGRMGGGRMGGARPGRGRGRGFVGRGRRPFKPGRRGWRRHHHWGPNWGPAWGPGFYQGGVWADAPYFYGDTDGCFVNVPCEPDMSLQINSYNYGHDQDLYDYYSARDPYLYEYETDWSDHYNNLM